MPPIPFTPQQIRAIETTGRSIIVTAAAGSGKTAVLAQRCAYLVCDAPVPFCCDVDALLVLTFTEAASAEMRSRIVDAIRARAQERPNEPRLREQVALSDAAQISTIHSFCLWVVRRWFNEAGIDPSSAMLDEHESRLIKREVLEGVFEGLYRELPKPNPSLGQTRDLGGGACEANTEETPTLPEAFRHLVDVYGLGQDRDIAKFVMKLFEFTTSLPDPDGWLDEAGSLPIAHGDEIILELLSTLPEELQRQINHCEGVLSGMKCTHGASIAAREKIQGHADSLRKWLSGLPTTQLSVYAAVGTAIKEYQFSSERSPPLSRDEDPQIKEEVAIARALLKDVKAMFGKRLQDRYALFSIEAWREGLRAVAPFVVTLTTLVRRFAEAYAARKRELNVLDFSDLERFAHRLLREAPDPTKPQGPAKPSRIALELHKRFAHVLVDEFQDVNPLQQEILRLVSHESDDTRSGNLFVVGDVKQSIYRFRLAAPALFVERLHQFREPGADGEAISLQQNFRSRAHLLEAINEVFRLLMPCGTGGIEYDAEAELHPGRTEPDEPPAPIELHLLERDWKNLGDSEEGDTETDDAAEPEPETLLSDDPKEWSAIEREARLIGRRIQEWMQTPPNDTDAEPLRYGDIAVLVRAAKTNAERIAAMLSAMGVPAHADVGGSLFAAVEVRDVLAALELLDNAQQDIPLAAVMRSGVFGHRFSENDLLTIRLLDQQDDYHRVVRRYAGEGDQEALRDRVAAFCRQIDRMRVEAHRRPPADLLWKIYGEFGHIAHVSGMIHGSKRRANLLKLHDLARKFGSFRRQGLHRFLRFVDAMIEADDKVPLASSVGEAADVVRVLTIHKSKGLEFPVVFLAGLGSKFNLGDRTGRMIHQPKAKLGLRVIDVERMIEYPSAAYVNVANEDERESFAEELRILYVAMTRARDRLVMVGSCREAEAAAKEIEKRRDGRDSSQSLGPAKTPLDWLVSAIGIIRSNAKANNADACGSFSVQAHTPDMMLAWQSPTHCKATGSQAGRRAVAALAALPSAEPTDANDDTAAAVRARLDYVYPYLPTTSVHATVAASQHKDIYDFTGAPQPPMVAASLPPAKETPPPAFEMPPSKYEQAASTSASQRGIITHRALQHLDFAVAQDAKGVEAELQRLVEAGILRAGDRDELDVAALVWFVETPLAEAIRTAGTDYRREFQYVTAEPPSYFDSGIAAPDDDFVLVRGVVDGILPVADGVEVIDFKTDAVEKGDVAVRVERYRSQMALYRRAVSRIWHLPVTAARLVFLTPRVVVDVKE